MEEPMKNLARILFVISLLFCIPMTASADVAALISQGDALFKYDNGTMADYLKSANLYKDAAKQDPKNFEAAWKAARSLRYYAETAKQTSAKGWKEICKKTGKEGMEYAQKAIDLQKDKADGYYWYALNVGIYSDGVSILTAISEGLKDKTQSSFEKVLKLDKNYEKCAALVGIGRFWSVLPFPMRDRKKALKYFNEYKATSHFGTSPEGVVFMAELLIDMGGQENKDQAKTLLTDLKTDNAYFKKYAQDLLKKV
jgi:tetratricopeptide (TPR) repeat protein